MNRQKAFLLLLYWEYTCTSLPHASTQTMRACINFHLHRQRTPWSAINYVYLNVSDCVTHIWPILMALGRVRVYNYVTKFHGTFLSMTNHACT